MNQARLSSSEPRIIPVTKMLSISRHVSSRPRLSVLLAIEPTGQSSIQGTDSLAKFEATLISLLENRPEDTEIIVCHDGSYDDPFDLCDEVRFCVVEDDAYESDSAVGLLDLWRAGLEVANGAQVSLLGAGARVMLGWADSAQQHFENESCGVVSGHIETPELQGDGVKLNAIMPAFGGQVRLAEVSESRLATPLLVGSFWRRELLASVLQPLSPSCEAALSLVATQAALDAGWKVAFDDGCLIDRATPKVEEATEVRSLCSEWIAGGWIGRASVLVGGAVSGITSLHKPGRLAAAIAKVSAGLWTSSQLDGIDPSSIYDVEEYRQTVEVVEPLRRVA